MFKRRHPYLFFILVFAGIVSVSVILLNVVAGLMLTREKPEKGERVGIIEIEGMILDAKSITGSLKRFRTDDTVKAVVVRIESPGGAVGPSQEVYAEIKKYAGVKPIVASMGAIAASGGYYAAAAADGIMASPGTITGSIGVLMKFTDFRELFEKIGIQSSFVKSGEYKDMGSPFRSISEDEKKLLQDFADSVHTQFIRDVAAGRNLAEEAVRDLADGMIFTGEFAKNAGLVDRLGNFNDAVEWAGRKGGIEDEIITVYPPAEKFPLVRKIMEMSVRELEAMVRRINSKTLEGGYIYDPSAAGGVRQ